MVGHLLALLSMGNPGVFDLKADHLVNPLGLESSPVLSWRLDNAVEQSAYRLQVRRDGRLAWDSGIVKSSESVNVPYAGRPLTFGDDCRWRVEVWDELGRRSGWSEEARWTMGPGASDWHAKWIGSDQVFAHPPKSPNNIVEENTVSDPWLRNQFDLSEAPQKAFCYVASIGYHELYVNGIRVGDGVLEPAVSDVSKRARYVTYEIDKLLRPGANVIAVWLGVSWSIFPHTLGSRPPTPMLLAQAELSFADGSRRSIGTDESWLVHASPNKLLGVWDFMNYGGEEYDAQLEQPEWNSPWEVGVGTSHRTATAPGDRWKPATVYEPGVTVSAEKLEPNRPQAMLWPAKIERLEDGAYRVDMGVNFAGFLEVAVRGEPGDVVEFDWSEEIEHRRTHKLHSRYVIGSSGFGTFKNRFNYGVGRWITISGLRHAPEKGEIRGWCVRTDYARAAEFHSSNPLLNRIFDATQWTFENLSLGGYVVDCAQRERMGYGGDGHATTQMGLANYGLAAFYSKWAEDWRDTQGQDGSLPYTAPTYWGGGGPSWSGFCIHMPWQVYREYGDVRILRDNYPMMKRWLAFMETHAKDDLLVRWGGDWDFLGDWLWPGEGGHVNGDREETLCFNNCYWVYALRTMAKVADALHQSSDSRAYGERAEQVEKAVHARFFRAATHDYGTGDQQYLAMALLAEVPPASERAVVWKRLEEEILVHREGHIYAGITGGAVLTRLLLDSGRADLMLPMVEKEDFPSWGYLLNKGFTTIPEAWDGSGSGSHSSYLFVGAWFIEGLAGIQPTEPGYRRFSICPLLSVEEVSATHDTNYGRIAVAWKREGDRIALRLQVPPNSAGTLTLPAGYGFVSVPPSALLHSGSYAFEARKQG